MHAYDDLVEARADLRRYFGFYNDGRPHTAHRGSPPSAAYYASLAQQHAFDMAA